MEFISKVWPTDPSFSAAFFGAVVGGGFALLASYLAFLLNRKAQKEDDFAKSCRRKEILLLNIVLKLNEMAALTKALDNHLVSCFNCGPELVDAEPALKVTKFIGLQPRLSAEGVSLIELDLIYEMGDFGLAESVMNIQANFFSTVAAVHKFNKVLEKLDDLIAGYSLSMTPIDGDVSQNSLPIETYAQYDRLVVELNGLIGVISCCGEDSSKTVNLIKRVLSAAKQLEGVSVPQLTIVAGANVVQ